MSPAAVVTLADIARLAGVGRPAVSNWRRRHADFPQPTEETRAGPRFDLGQVRSWLAVHNRLPEQLPLHERLWRALDATRGVLSLQQHLEAATAVLAFIHLSATPMATGSLGSEPRLPDQLCWESLRELPPRQMLARLREGARVLEAQRPELRDVLTPDLEPMSEQHLALLESLDGLTRDNPVAVIFDGLLAMYQQRAGIRMAEHSTPPALADLLARLCTPARGVLYDPAAGYAGLMLAAARSAPSGQAPVLIGQDANLTAVRVARRRLLVHHLEGKISHGDSLAGQPLHLQADLIVADPPANMPWDGSAAARAGQRYMLGPPPADNANTAWLQHALAHLSDGGRAYVVLPMGSLFRPGPEAAIRRELVRRGVVEALIALPPGIHAGTGIPLVIWILHRPTKSSPNRGKILLINAVRKHATDTSTQLEPAAVDTAVEAYRQWRTYPERFAPVAGFSTTVAPDVLMEADCNLVPSRWIEPEELGDPVALRQRLSDAASQWRASTRDLTPPDTAAWLAGRNRDTAITAPLRTVRELALRGLLAIYSGTAITKAHLRQQGVPLVGGRSLSLEQLDHPAAFVNLGELGNRRIELTRPGDVIFLGTPTDIRALVDAGGGHVVAAPAKILRVDRRSLDPHVLAAFLQSALNRRYATGAALRHIDVRDLKIPLLPLEEQLELAQVWQSLLDYRNRLQAALTRTKILSDLLLDDALVGALDHPQRHAGLIDASDDPYQAGQQASGATS